MNPFKAIRRLIRCRRARKRLETLTQHSFDEIEAVCLKRQSANYVETQMARIIRNISNGYPFFVITHDGVLLTSMMHGLSKDAFCQAMKEFAKDSGFKEALTDIVIDINTEKK